MNWTVLCIPGSGHFEIYRVSGNRKELVKVTTSELDARRYVSTSSRDDDVVVFIQPDVAKQGARRLTGAELKAAARSA